MVCVSRSSTSTSASSTSFAPDTTGERYEDLYQQYDILTRTNPGWNLSSIRDMTTRERTYWLEVAVFHMTMRAGSA